MSVSVVFINYSNAKKWPLCSQQDFIWLKQRFRAVIFPYFKIFIRVSVCVAVHVNHQGNHLNNL